MTATAKDHGSLVAALAAIQPKLPIVGKGETATVPTKAGGQYSYSYADLADVTKAVYPLLGEVGLAFIAKPRYTDHGYLLEGVLAHVGGDRETAEFPLPDNGGPQAVGSAITYGRRYLLCALTGIVTGDDDDGRAAQDRWQRRETPPDPFEPFDSDDWQRRVDLCDSLTALAALATELGRAHARGAVEETRYESLVLYGKQRKDELTPDEAAL